MNLQIGLMLHVHNVHACMRIEKHDIGLTHELTCVNKESTELTNTRVKDIHVKERTNIMYLHQGITCVNLIYP